MAPTSPQGNAHSRIASSRRARSAGSATTISISAEAIRKLSDSQRVKNTEGSPNEIIMARRSCSSIIGPRMNPSTIGAYAVNSNATDLFVMAFFSGFGYLCLKLDCEPAPLILGFVLGPLMEENLRRSLLMSRGDLMVLVQEPISLMFLIASVLLLLVVAAPAIQKK